MTHVAQPISIYHSTQFANGSYHMNSPAYFEIQADDPERAIGFYKAVFGWGFTKATGLPIDYWRIQTEDMRGGLLKRPTIAPPQRSGTNAYVCSMQVEDFDGTAKAILKNGGQVALEKFAVPGTCWQGYFLDPEGNTFGVFQVDENAK
jgi:predicted enzyme related to lactoylglutathione lyase